MDSNDRLITTRSGRPLSRLGFAAFPGQDSRCVDAAFAGGINLFYFYDRTNEKFIRRLALLANKHGDDIVIASGTDDRDEKDLRKEFTRTCRMLGTDRLDIFFAEYVSPDDEEEAIFGDGGALDSLAALREEGLIRYAGASAHNRALATRLIEDGRIDILMHRHNMAHRKAERTVFPAARKAAVPILAFTATRWGTLLDGHPRWKNPSPSAADCYRYCLSQPAVKAVLCAAESLRELKSDLAVLDAPALDRKALDVWRRYGDLIYGKGTDRFETEWP